MGLDPQYLDAIKGFEGYSATPSWDYKQNSSGYGTRAQPGDENIPPDQLKAVHEQRFQDEVSRASDHVDSINPNLPPGAKAALTDLTYNAGPGWSQSGLGDLVRSGDLPGIAAKIQEYNKAGGQVLPGLVARRAQAASWINGPSPQGQQPAPASPATPPSAPLQIAAPIFAPQPQQAQQQPQQAAQEQAPFEMPAPMQAPPIFASPRPRVDLSKLRAAFPQPNFRRG